MRWAKLVLAVVLTLGRVVHLTKSYDSCDLWYT